MKLKHEDGEDYRANKVSVNYDGKSDRLAVFDDGTVECTNKKQAEELLENHGSFVKLDDEPVEKAGHVLEDLTVAEVKEYVSTVDDVDRLKELRKKEDRKTAKQKIDSRISQVDDSDQKVKEQEETKPESEDGEDAGEDEEDGEETENE